MGGRLADGQSDRRSSRVCRSGQWHMDRMIGCSWAAALEKLAGRW